jgi:hypothetical protein
MFLREILLVSIFYNLVDIESVVLFGSGVMISYVKYSKQRLIMLHNSYLLYFCIENFDRLISLIHI